MLFHYFLHVWLENTERKLDFPRLYAPLLNIIWKDYQQSMSQPIIDYLHKHFKESPILDTNIAFTITEYLHGPFTLFSEAVMWG